VLLPLWTAHIPAFVGALILSWYLTPVAVAAARRRGLLDHPGDHKVQPEAVPYLGGAAIVASFCISVALVSVTLGTTARGELLLIVGLALVLATVGLVDDIRGLGPWVRVVCEVVAGLAVWASGIGVVLTGIGVVDAVLTVAWIVGITNSFNLLDNMDGLSAGVAAIAAGGYFALAAFQGQFLVAALAAGLAGCTVGFLRHNFHPARVYMGDAGSLFLGFMLSVIALKLRFPAVPPWIAWTIPLMVVGVAILDTALVVAGRLVHRRPVTQGGRDHASHRLVFVGLPIRVAVGMTYGVAAACGYIALVVSLVPPAPGLMLAALVLVTATIAGVTLGRVPVYETSTRRRWMLTEVKAHEVEPAAPPRGHDKRESA